MSEQKRHETEGGSNQIGALNRGQGLARQETTGNPEQSNKVRPRDAQHTPKLTFQDTIGTGNKRMMPDRQAPEGEEGRLVTPHAWNDHHE